jgi:hypothetical protein
MQSQNTLGLEEMTQTYWRLSRVWNGHSAELIETGIALLLCNDMVYSVNPVRPIVRVSKQLRDEIVIDARPQRSETAKVLQLRKA